MKSRGVPGGKRFPPGVPPGNLSKRFQLRLFLIGRPKRRYVSRGPSVSSFYPCGLACVIPTPTRPGCHVTLVRLAPGVSLRDPLGVLGDPWGSPEDPRGIFLPLRTCTRDPHSHAPQVLRHAGSLGPWGFLAGTPNFIEISAIRSVVTMVVAVKAFEGICPLATF